MYDVFRKLQVLHKMELLRLRGGSVSKDENVYIKVEKLQLKELESEKGLSEEKVALGFTAREVRCV